MENLKFLRNNAGLSQAGLAKKLKMPQTTYSHYESGRSEPSVDTLIQLAKFFNCSIDYLLGYQTDSANLVYGFTPAQKSLLGSIQELSDENCKRVRDFIDGILTVEEEKKNTIRRFRN